VPVLCPHCRNKAIRRSKRRGMLESSLLSLIYVRPFRCKDCDYRFYGFISPMESTQYKSAAPR